MNPSLLRVSLGQGAVFTHAQALSAGYSATEIRRLVTAGTWTRMRRGVLASTAEVDAREGQPRSCHLHRAAAHLLALSGDVLLSHRSAALAWGLPLVGRPPDLIALTVERQHRRRTSGLELHTARTPQSHRALVDGLPVTSPARTVSDLCRQLAFGPAVVAADAALQTGLCTPADVQKVIDDCWVWRGIARSKRVAAFADGRAESPGESLSRVAFAGAGLPAPDTQVELVLDGQLVRVDFLWREQRLVGEFDGRVKYGGPDDLWREKQREDLIRRHGYGVVRWIWSETYPNPQAAVDRVARALTTV